MIEPVKGSVAALIRRRGGAEYLAVRRPADDPSLGGHWGLPAATLFEGELPEAGIERIGREKLGVELQPVRFLGADSARRKGYTLVLLDIEAEIIHGEPDISLATTAATRYVEARWTSDTALLRPAAAAGSLCCRIILDRERVRMEDT